MRGTFLVMILVGWGCSAPPPEAIPKIEVDAGGLSGSDAASMTCGPANCDGCCDEDRCRLGLEDAACGARGVACTPCGTGTCLQGACAAPGCGDGVVDDGEQCDGSVASTCAELGFSGGVVTCSGACQIDTSACEPQSCANAEASGASCDFCSPDQTMLTRCGFCRNPLIDGTPRPDEQETCAADALCRAWRNPDDDQRWLACLDSPPVTCSQSEVGRCEQAEAVSCGFDGRQRRRDCTELPGGRCITYESPTSLRTEAACIDADARPCVYEVEGSSCDGDDLIECAESGYTRRRPCREEIEGAESECLQGGGTAGCFEAGRACVAEGVRCDADAVVACEPVLGGAFLREREVRDCGEFGGTCAVTSLGPECVQPGTTACDASTYVPNCQGDRRFECHTARGWEQVEDCSAESMTCHDIVGVGPRCAPTGFTPCDYDTTDATCNGASGTQCLPFDLTTTGSPGWLQTVDCPTLNPICAATGKLLRCISDPSTDCTPTPGDPDDFVATGFALRCDGSDIVVCDTAVNKELRYDCAADGGNWICREPDGSGCVGDPCWCARP